MSTTSAMLTSNTSTDLETRIEIILRQTTLTREEAIEKLHEFNNDHIKVIKSFMGIPEKSSEKIVSINQQIYKEIRNTLGYTPVDFKDIAK